jgi:hypothetical protein
VELQYNATILFSKDDIGKSYHRNRVLVLSLRWRKNKVITVSMISIEARLGFQAPGLFEIL